MAVSDKCNLLTIESKLEHEARRSSVPSALHMRRRISPQNDCRRIALSAGSGKANVIRCLVGSRQGSRITTVESLPTS